MKTPLHKQLTDYIKLHGQVHFRDIEKYAEENGYKAYTAIRRLQEVRDPKHVNFDKTIKTVEENGTIKWYVFDTTPAERPISPGAASFLNEWGPEARKAQKLPPAPQISSDPMF